MAIITLLSDWGLADHHVAAVKGRLYGAWPQGCVVDISHQIPRQNNAAAAYVLQQAYPHFPPGSVHCIGVNAIATARGAHIIVQENGHYFIGSVGMIREDGSGDSIFTRLFDHKPEKVWRITLESEGQSDVFPSLNLFPKVAIHLAQGGSPDEVGEPYTWPSKLFMSLDEAYLEDIFNAQGEKTGLRLRGSILYMDNWGNGVTNISKSLFDQALSEFPRFEICLPPKCRTKEPITKISRAYHQVPKSDLCALFLDNQLLEISLNGSSAAQLLGLLKDDSITIKFKL